MIFTRLKDRRGMTLIEIMVVLAIIAIIAGVLGKGLFNRLGRAKIKTTVMKVKAVEEAVKEYRLDLGKYPDSLADLVAKQYLEGDAELKDPFGCDLQYNKSGANGKPEIFSYGNEDCSAQGDGIRSSSQ